MKYRRHARVPIGPLERISPLRRPNRDPMKGARLTRIAMAVVSGLVLSFFVPVLQRQFGWQGDCRRQSGPYNVLHEPTEIARPRPNMKDQTVYLAIRGGFVE